MSRAVRQTYVIDGRAFEAELQLDDSGLSGRVIGRVVQNDDETAISVPAGRGGDGRIRLEIDGRVVRATVVRDRETAWVCIDGHTFEVAIEDFGASHAQSGAEEPFAVSPMTGLVAKVSVAVGDESFRSRPTPRFPEIVQPMRVGEESSQLTPPP